MWSIRFRQKSSLVYPRYSSTKQYNSSTLEPLSVLSKRYDYHRDYLSQLIRKGEIEGEKIGRSWCTTPAEIERYKMRKQYVTLWYLVKPYFFEIVLLILGMLIVALSIWYWYDTSSPYTEVQTQNQLDSDLDIPISYHTEAQ